MSTPVHTPTGGEVEVEPATRGWFNKATLGWIGFDLANTIWSYTFLTRYFNDWIVDDKGRPDWQLGLMGLCASLALICLLPILGSVADRWGRRKPILIAATLWTIGLTFLLGFVDSATVALALGALAIIGYQTALAQYDPLLATVAEEPRRSLVSGLGVGAGYLGVLMTIGLFSFIVSDDPQTAFIPAAILFGVFSIPCFIWVREGAGRRIGNIRKIASEAFKETKRAVGFARKNSFGRLLIARFLYIESVSTIIAYMVIYSKRVAHLSEGQISIVLALSIVFSIIGAIGSGLIAKRIGAAKTTRMVVALTIVTLLFGAALGSIGIWILGPLVGICLGGINACDRVLALELAPEEQRGALFGLNALVGKVSSGIGPLFLWGGTILIAHEVFGLSLATSSRIALVSLAASAFAGWIILKPLANGYQNKNT